MNPAEAPRRPDAGALPVHDLVVIGAGIIGAGIARDAALRGLKVALVEKEDLGWGTSARSTRLVHGGLRYLEHLDIGLVREALRERGTLMRIAPHLVAPLPMLFPIWKGTGRHKFVVRIGMFLYDILARKNVGTGHHWWSREEVRKREPTLDRPELKGGFLFWDCQTSYPERLVVENALDAHAHGATVLTHSEVVGLEQEGTTASAVVVRDRLSGDERMIPCRLVVNTAGPWVTEVDNRLGTRAPAMTRRTKGIHLVTPPICQNAMVLQCGDGERIIFVIPWNGLNLIGTTDTDYTGPNDTVAATVDDVRYLLDEVNNVLQVTLTPEDVHYAYAGIRSLIHETKGTTGAVSRRHLVVEHAGRDGPDNLVTVVGGKITAYRHISEDVTDLLCERLGSASVSRTATTPLPGSGSEGPEALLALVGSRLPHLTDTDVDRLHGIYGFRIGRLVEMAPLLQEGPGFLHPNTRVTREEVLLAIEEEWAVTLEDVLLRRTMAGLDAGLGLDLVDPVATLMADRLGWDKKRRDAEVAHYLATVARNRAAVEALAEEYRPGDPDERIAKKRI
ncbi:MAG: glycerol-3-phosphate dehydrogenase [Euryarchaeota archaeon]|nr:glycerol-3-phosphate dehydrogenase [Euryarchaeota archaeon]